jgi:hypothetical protein
MIYAFNIPIFIFCNYSAAIHQEGEMPVLAQKAFEALIRKK